MKLYLSALNSNFISQKLKLTMRKPYTIFIINSMLFTKRRFNFLKRRFVTLKWRFKKLKRHFRKTKQSLAKIM
jgi:hypothetical protein